MWRNFILFTDWMKYREEEENRNMKQRQRQNMTAENKNGGKEIERLHPFTECVIQPMQTANDTTTIGSMCRSNINIIYSDDSFRDLIDFSAAYGCKTEIEDGCEYKCSSDVILL